MIDFSVLSFSNVELGMLLILSLIGLVSAFFYVRQKQWLSTVLVLTATVCLAMLVIEPTMKVKKENLVRIASNLSSSQLQNLVQNASKLLLDGDGLREAQWQDLPHLPLQWSAPKQTAIRLFFPQKMALGRMFQLRVEKLNPQEKNEEWKLQLLAENGIVLSEAKGKDASLSVDWLPPVAERLVLQARLLNAKGNVIDQGPIPFVVEEFTPLSIVGRFSAPSFDLQTLNQLLANSDARLDWQVTMGKSMLRKEVAKEKIEKAELLLIDAAYYEKSSTQTRQQLLRDVASGIPLLILGGNANDSALWKREFELSLFEHNLDSLSLIDVNPQVALMPANFQVNAQKSGIWSPLLNESVSAKNAWVWQRPWKQGFITWLALADWHRYAINDRLHLSLWWQDVLDAAQVKRQSALIFTSPDVMPIENERTRICARGDLLKLSIIIKEDNKTQQKLILQKRANQIEMNCAAFWPKQSGWVDVQEAQKSQELQSSGVEKNKQNPVSTVYIYKTTDWPLWQKNLRHDATRQYAAHVLDAQKPKPTKLPQWPFAVLLMACLLGLWWKERR
jgi:hypothetical protein